MPGEQITILLWLGRGLRRFEEIQSELKGIFRFCEIPWGVGGDPVEMQR
ncbi:hypothetical protein H6762_01430 [Candidatus Nomurabacteria bacterium]|nr:hypothetical protein [Candidatus Nomurabacteria bacterium]